MRRLTTVEVFNIQFGLISRLAPDIIDQRIRELNLFEACVRTALFLVGSLDLDVAALMNDEALCDATLRRMAAGIAVMAQSDVTNPFGGPGDVLIALEEELREFLSIPQGHN